MRHALITTIWRSRKDDHGTFSDNNTRRDTWLFLNRKRLRKNAHTILAHGTNRTLITDAENLEGISPFHSLWHDLHELPRNQRLEARTLRHFDGKITRKYDRNGRENPRSSRYPMKCRLTVMALEDSKSHRQLRVIQSSTSVRSYDLMHYLHSATNHMFIFVCA